MADPTASAYARVNRLGSPRPTTPTLLNFTNADLTPAVDYQNKFPIWTMVRDCYDGEQTIKAAGQTYLPKLPAHKQADYDSYKMRASFYNAVRRTHRGFMGSLFRKPVELTLPPRLEAKLDLNRLTITNESFPSFCRTLAHEILLVGRYGMLVDFRDNNADSPYIAGYTAENIYGWRKSYLDGRLRVDRVVLLEEKSVPTEFGYSTETIVRILRLDPKVVGGVRKLVYSQTVLRPNPSDPKVPPTREDIAFNIRGRTLDYIPFVFVNAVGLEPEVGPAPLEDIAVINLSHYQSSAHLEYGRIYAGLPTYWTSGDSGASDMLNQVANAAAQGADASGIPTIPGNAMTVGPQYVWSLEKDAKAGLLEFTGHGLTFLENALDSKQLMMQSLGGRLISSTRRAAAMSDEGWRLLEAGDEATLMDVAITCDAGLGRAIGYMADIMGVVDDPLDCGVLVEFNKEFTPSELTARELRALQSLRERAHIPEDVMYYALRSVGVIPIEITLEDFKKLMDQKDQQYEPPAPPPMPGGGGPGVRPGGPPLPSNRGGDG